ncbi:MAG TPA: amidohydrolase family protein [Gaiellaceae bacterium]|nr:amidohydrolase family protein [Gaiellaceae bacterium]
MDGALARADELVASYDEEARRLLPEGAEIFDAHTHLGRDVDGMVGEPGELLAQMDHYGVSQANVFCLDEPDRVPAFRAGNDRTLAFAEEAGGRLIPFVRLDLADDPIGEAKRCLDRGARGIKLHPRAQGFLLNDERLDPIFALSAERRVPILIHGGRGLPPIAADLHALLERHDEAQLIIAHLGIADLGNLAHHFSGRAGVFFDTSVWSPIDLLDFFGRVPPEQVLYASDYPYGDTQRGLLLTLLTSRAAGLDEARLRDLLAGSAKRIASGEPPLEPTAPCGSDTFSQPTQLARIHQYLSMATPMFWTQQPDTVGVLGLALNACGENGRVEAAPIAELISTARELWRAFPEIEGEDERRRAARSTFRLIHLADILAVTSGG